MRLGSSPRAGSRDVPVRPGDDTSVNLGCQQAPA